MPGTKNFHGLKNILLDNDDWMVVDPLDYDAFVYYAPEYMKSEWDTFKQGDTYFVIDKNEQYNNGFVTYAIHKEDDKVHFYNAYGSTRPKNDILSKFPDEVKNVVDDIIGYGEIYTLLLKVMNGEEVSSREMERADDSIYDFRYSPRAPLKSKITFMFDEEEYVKLFDPSEEDIWYYNAINSRYDTYEFEDSYQAKQDFEDGYIERYFNSENIVKLKEILSIIAPESLPLETESQRKIAGQKLYDMFEREIDYIIEEWVYEDNSCRSRAFQKEITEDLCNQFYQYDIFTQTCMFKYFTSVGLLMDLYDYVGDKTLSIQELLFKLGSDLNVAGWGDYVYEYHCDDFDEEGLNSRTAKYLDEIMEKLEDESRFKDIHEYSELYKRLDSQFKKGEYYKTKYDKRFIFNGIDPEDNKIHVVVDSGNGQGSQRSYTEEEFNNFLVSPELFEGFIRIN